MYIKEKNSETKVTSQGFHPASNFPLANARQMVNKTIEVRRHKYVLDPTQTYFSPNRLTRVKMGSEKGPKYTVTITHIGGERNRIGRREKWPKKGWEEGEIGGKVGRREKM